MKGYKQSRLKGVLFDIIGASLWGLGGTALAFYLFIDSLKYLSAKETTLFGTIEPVVAVIASGLFLHVSFKPLQILGIIIIVVLILVLSLKKQPDIENLKYNKAHTSVVTHVSFSMY